VSRSSLLARVMPRSLSRRLALVVGLLIAALTALLLVAVPTVLARQSRQWMRSRAAGMATVFSASLEPPLDFDDTVGASAQLSALGHAPTVAYARVLRRDGTALADWSAGNATRPPPGLAALSGPQVVFTSDHVHVAVPVWSRGAPGELSGSLVMGFDLSELRAQEEAAAWMAGAVSVLVLLLGLSGAFLIGTVFARPIRRVTEAAQRIAAGDLEARWDLDSTRVDETGQMASAIGAMVQRLAEQRAMLKRRVAERTRELAEANALLEAKLGELHATQQQLILADRRVAVGRLAAGVAHEINNPLAYVIANVDHVRAKIPEVAGVPCLGPAEHAALVSDVLDALADARGGCERVRRIVLNLRTASHGDEDERSAVDVHAVLDGAIQMAANEIRHRARLVTRLGRVPQVQANELRLGQVFLNLLINAAQAIQRGSVEENEIAVETGTDARGWAVVRIRDTGSGIPDEIRQQLFAPFFTTKAVGEGTGLGLSICQGIVSSLGGTIAVDSSPGRGSAFQIALPPSADGHRPDLPRGGEPGPARAGVGRRRGLVLVVDDDVRVARALRRTLSAEHEVETAAGGREALARIAGGRRYDLVLCDLMMPDMTGMDLYSSLEREGLGPSVLFISGGAFTPAAQDFAERHGDRLIAKPVDPDVLLARVRSALDPG